MKALPWSPKTLFTANAEGPPLIHTTVTYYTVFETRNCSLYQVCLCVFSQNSVSRPPFRNRNCDAKHFVLFQLVGSGYLIRVLIDVSSFVVLILQSELDRQHLNIILN